MQAIGEEGEGPFVNTKAVLVHGFVDELLKSFSCCVVLQF